MERTVLGHTTRTFSVGLKVSGQRLVFISGLLPWDDSGKLVATDLPSQTRYIFDWMDRLMKEAGGSLKKVVRISAYMTSVEEYSAYSKIRGEYFAGNLPASTVIQVVGLVLDGALIEIDAVAVLD
jgi:2-iminobutanoate/2-iminopropanoate deaminase